VKAAPARTSETEDFAAAFDIATGTLALRRRDGTPFLTGGVARVNTSAGHHSTASAGCDYALTTDEVRDALGAGRRLRVECRDPGRALDLVLDVVAYDKRPLVTVEARCTNVSSRDVIVRSLEPLRALAAEGGALHVPGVASCVTNGEMFYDAGALHEFARAPRAQEAPPPVERAPPENGDIAAGRATVRSWWNVGLSAGHGREGVALGYVESSSQGYVLLARTAEGEISFVAESVLAPPIVLAPGRSIGSSRFALTAAPSAHAALERYADAAGALQHARTRSIVNGWCSWFYTLTHVSEDEVLRNAQFAAEHLRAYGLDYVQVDDGYQRSHGDWQGNERFPHGMQWLAGEIRAKGFRPGIWIAPYVVSEHSDVFRHHPEWLVRRGDGSLQRIGNWASETSTEALRERVRHYCLDITHPGAAEWLRELFVTLAQRWGYEMIKIDFMAWSILAAERFHDPARSSAEVYRRGVEIMRAAAGEGCHLQDCGPGNVTVGLVDSMRIEADTNYGYADAAWKQYFGDPACSAAAAARRYFFHRRTWVNDVDHVCLDLLAPPQAQAVATLVALSGGNTISGDRLVDLEPAKLEILKKILPAYGAAAVPVDLFEDEMPATFVLHVERPFARWTVVALFNADRAAGVERRIALERLQLDPRADYLAFDFWNQRFAGSVKGELVASVAPGAVTLLALHAATGAPQLLSTNRHVLQGALEIEDVRWDEGARTLHGVSLGPPGSAHDVFVFVPAGLPWAWDARHIHVRDYASSTVRVVDANVVRVHVRFGHEARAAWRVDLNDLAR
jgi:hypothetical protein